MDEKNQTETYNMLISTLFREKSWEQRANAAQQIGYIADGRATNLLVKALNSEKDSVVINRIIEALGRIKDSKATMPIVKFLQDELEKAEQDRNRLFVIIESLMKIGDKRSLSQLGILHKSCETDIKELTEKAFDCIDPDWKENIKKL
ncbi:hypothetical protein LCGC14_0785010 [marine sediment metagenome]|uniref:HEAT repeat domain-containing protein n=1 Tax=marine sediment metagenome TaxID=412755 RepID=A0A0F9SEB0_9ZZZZ